MDILREKDAGKKLARIRIASGVRPNSCFSKMVQDTLVGDGFGSFHFQSTRICSGHLGLRSAGHIFERKEKDE